MDKISNGKEYWFGSLFFEKRGFFKGLSLYGFWEHAEIQLDTVEPSGVIEFNNERCPKFEIDPDSLTFEEPMRRDALLIDKFVWCRPYGLVEYTYKNGATYRLAKIKRRNGQEIEFEQ